MAIQRSIAAFPVQSRAPRFTEVVVESAFMIGEVCAQLLDDGRAHPQLIVMIAPVSNTAALTNHRFVAGFWRSADGAGMDGLLRDLRARAEAWRAGMARTGNDSYLRYFGL